MNEVNWALYTRDVKKAEELHETIKSIARDESWFAGIPEDLISYPKMHARARISGIITDDEYDLLRRIYK